MSAISHTHTSTHKVVSQAPIDTNRLIYIVNTAPTKQYNNTTMAVGEHRTSKEMSLVGTYITRFYTCPLGKGNTVTAVYIFLNMSRHFFAFITDTIAVGR